MSAKPTPGPYTIRRDEGGCLVRGILGVAVGWFGRASISGSGVSHHISSDEAEANARAWVDGMEAREELDRIHAVVREWGESRRSSGACMVDIAKILDEDKP